MILNQESMQPKISHSLACLFEEFRRHDGSSLITQDVVREGKQHENGRRSSSI